MQAINLRKDNLCFYRRRYVYLEEEKDDLKEDSGLIS